MKYYSEKDLNAILDARDRRILPTLTEQIEVSFCENCEDFVPTTRNHGWCRARSQTLADCANADEVQYFLTRKDSFCDRRTIML